ncbi:Crp/Fnr family transcriptional regulator [Clostridiaceae bacterium M8S5]|nr:Crp/Fnr family transcriptional regulator [Clostridiaceae bacterium M8S5]
MKNIANYLYDTVLFRGKNINEIAEILSTIDYNICSYKKNDLIFNVEQSTKNIGIILEGCIEVQKNLANGNIINILYKKTGDLFGEGSVFSKASTYPCNIYSETESTILLVSKNAMLELLSSDKQLLDNFLSSFANRVLMLNLKAELLCYSSIQKKIAFSLLYLMNEHTYGNTVRLPFTKKTWSEHLNVSRPSFFREIKKLQKQNILHINDRDITILDMDNLTNIINK